MGKGFFLCCFRLLRFFRIRWYGARLAVDYESFRDEFTLENSAHYLR